MDLWESPIAMPVSLLLVWFGVPLVVMGTGVMALGRVIKGADEKVPRDACVAL